MTTNTQSCALLCNFLRLAIIEIRWEADFFDKVARTSPEKAADKITRGMLAGKPRILIGPDAWALDKLIRALPLKHWPLVRSQMEWK